MLATLASSFQADTGIPCQYAETGDPVELRSAVKLALYRVTQEALTNIRKHAHPERVEVHLAYLKDGVSLEVEDFAALAYPPAPSAGSIETSGGGYGLTGMRERAELLDGTLTAGPTGRGFRVDLRIPA
jgi:signal transduction histidine kinase